MSKLDESELTSIPSPWMPLRRWPGSQLRTLQQYLAIVHRQPSIEMYTVTSHIVGHSETVNSTASKFTPSPPKTNLSNVRTSLSIYSLKKVSEFIDSSLLSRKLLSKISVLTNNFAFEESRGSASKTLSWNRRWRMAHTAIQFSWFTTLNDAHSI